jgi:hypothetical protein
MIASGIAVIVAIIAFTVVLIVVFAVVSRSIPISIIVGVIKLPITLSVPRHSTLAQLEPTILSESADINKETPDFVLLPPIWSNSPQTVWARDDGLVFAHDMVDRLPRIHFLGKFVGMKQSRIR